MIWTLHSNKMLHLKKKKFNIILKKDSNVLLIFDVGHVATTIHKQVCFCTFFMYTLLKSYPPNWTCYGKMCIPCLVVSGNWTLLALVRWSQQQKNKKLLHHKPPGDLVASQRCLQTVASLKMCNESLWPYSPGPPCHHDCHMSKMSRNNQGIRPHRFT